MNDDMYTKQLFDDNVKLVKDNRELNEELNELNKCIRQINEIGDKYLDRRLVAINVSAHRK